MTDITHWKKVYVSTSKSADYVSAVHHEGSVEFVRADRVQALADALRFYVGPYENPNEGPWGVNSQDYGYGAAVALKAWEDGE